MLLEIQALILCLDVVSLSTSGSAGALLSPVFVFCSFRISELFILTKSLYWPDVFVSLLIVLTTPNLSMVPVGVCLILLGRTFEADSRSKVNLLVIILFFLMEFTFIACTRSHGKWKDVSKKFFTLSENDADVACFSVTPAIIVLTLGDRLVATTSVEMSDSSDISSRSNVPVDVAKSWPCSTGVDSLASLQFSLLFGPCTS